MTINQIRKLPVGALLYWSEFEWRDFDLDCNLDGWWFVIVQKELVKGSSFEFTFEATGWFGKYLIEEQGDDELLYSTEWLRDHAQLTRIA